MPWTALAWLQLVLATPVVLWAGAPFFERALVSLRNRSPNMFTLIALGTGAAWGCCARSRRSSRDSSRNRCSVYRRWRTAALLEAAAVITVLVLPGR
ncbi:MAG: hypothetical protein U1F09_16260 [Steroidobacteraceae bacterium]